MSRLHSFAIEHPARVLAIWLFILLACAPGILRLRLSTDGRALIPKSAPAVLDARAIREEFGVLDPIVVAIESKRPEGIYRAHTLALVADLTRELAKLPGIREADVVSLATEPGDHVRPGSFELLAWLDPLPSNDEAIAGLRKGLERTPIYRGTLLSSDTPASATVILLGVPEDCDRQALCASVESAVKGRALEQEEIHVVGAPVAESELGLHLLDDLARLVPIAFLVMGAIFYASFRSFAAVFVALCVVGVALVCTLGLMGWTGAPVYLTILVIPVILTTVGVADAVHVFDRYVRELRVSADHRAAEDHRAALGRAMDEMRRPIVNSSITTAIGFLSFAVSPIPAVGVFGVFMAVGVLVCLVASLSGVPAALAWIGPASFASAVARRANTAGKDRSHRLGLFARGIVRRSRLVLACSAVVLLVAGVFAARTVEIQDSWIEGFSRRSELSRATARIDHLFGGTHLLRLRLAADAPDLRLRVERSSFDGSSFLLETRIERPTSSLIGDRMYVRAAQDEAPIHGNDNGNGDTGRTGDAALGVPTLELLVTEASPSKDGTRLTFAHPLLGSTSLRDLLPSGEGALEVTFSTAGKLQQIARLDTIREFEGFLASETAQGVGRVLGPWEHLVSVGAIIGGAPELQAGLLHTKKGLDRAIEMYRRGRGEPRWRQLFSAKGDRALVTVLLRNANFVGVSHLLANVEEYEREHLAPAGIRLTAGGDIALSQALIDGIVRTQVSSLLLSFVGILLTTWIMTRSFTLGIACAVPSALAVVVNFALMGAFHIPLGVAVSMFAAMTIGIGDDYAIHLVDRLRMKRKSLPEGEAIAAATVESAPAIAIDALSVVAGFSVLLLSSVPTNARLGGLLVSSTAVCLAATLVILPASLAAIRSKAQ